GNAPAERLGDMQRHALQQLVLGAEVVVERGRRHVGRSRDLLHGRRRHALPRQHADGGGDQLPARALALGQPCRGWRLGGGGRQRRQPPDHFGLTLHFWIVSLFLERTSTK